MPILLLDEVVAELDEQRRAFLLDYVQNSQQAVLTATDPSMFTNNFLNQASSILVEDGRITFDQSRAKPNSESILPTT